MTTAQEQPPCASHDESERRADESDRHDDELTAKLDRSFERLMWTICLCAAVQFALLGWIVYKVS